MESEERLRIFEENGANANAVYLLKEAVEYGLTEEELDYLEQPWTTQVMKWILEGLRSGMTLEQVRIFSETQNGKSVFNAAQMGQYVAGFQEGIPMEELRDLLLPEFNARTMGELIKHYLEGKKGKSEWKQDRIDLIKTLEMVQEQYERLGIIEKSYQDSQKSSQEFIQYLQKELEYAREKEKRLLDTLEEIKQENQKLSFFFQKQQQSEVDTMDKTEKQMEEPLKEQWIELNEKESEKGGNHSVTIYLQKLFHKRSEEEQLIRLFGKLPEENLEQIRLGIEHGLSMKEVMQFARIGLSAKQAEQSRLILELRKQKREG